MSQKPRGSDVVEEESGDRCSKDKSRGSAGLGVLRLGVILCLLYSHSITGVLIELAVSEWYY